MDPLVKVKEAYEKGTIPKKIYKMIMRRFSIVVEGITRIEKASNIHFPLAYVEPAAIVSGSHQQSFGILFARTIPFMYQEKLKVVIQISAPLVAYGLKGTIHSILAHEFLHYLEFIRKISKMEILSDEISSNLFESEFADASRLFEARAVFNDKTLLNHITKRFPEGFRDYKLEDKTTEFWIEKQLPTVDISLDANVTKLSVKDLSKVRIDPVLEAKIGVLVKNTSKLRKKKIS